MQEPSVGGRGTWTLPRTTEATKPLGRIYVRETVSIVPNGNAIKSTQIVFLECDADTSSISV